MFCFARGVRVQHFCCELFLQLHIASRSQLIYVIPVYLNTRNIFHIVNFSRPSHCLIGPYFHHNNKITYSRNISFRGRIWRPADKRGTEANYRERDRRDHSYREMGFPLLEFTFLYPLLSSLEFVRNTCTCYCKGPLPLLR